MAASHPQSSIDCMRKANYALYRKPDRIVPWIDRVRRIAFLMFYTIPYLASFLAGAATFFVCLNAKRISSWLGIMDMPNERKHHENATPLIGGVALQVAYMPAAATVILMYSAPGWTPSLLVWLACVLAMTLVGLADDRHSLSARDRLLISFLVFGSAEIVDPMFSIRVLDFEHLGFTMGLGTGWLAVIFTAICCVGLVNAVNMADGKNGLVIGLCIGWAALIAIRAPMQLLPLIGLLIAVLVVLMIFNLRGRLFLGDGGAYGLATAIGLLAIMTYNARGNHAGRAIAADELVLLFAVPVIDSFRLTFVRIRRGQSPMAADRDHLHHHLQNWFGWPGGLIVYLVLALLPAGMFFILGI
jgi:UDP-GlcNAc:undecaprenyl-phosphate/decaprenyl-phosphate GlcNAc-1-phosphate transferase